MRTDIPAEYYDQDDSTNVCYLCGNPRYVEHYRVTHFDFPFVFQQCQTCGLIKQTPMPNEAFFDWFFNSDVFFSSKKTGKGYIWGYYDYFADEPYRLATSQWRFKRLRTWFDQKGQPLDIMKIGPATGTMLHVAKQQGHRVLGCDVSNRFAEYARTTYGVEIEHGRFEQKGYDGQFDMVLLFNVIENVPNQVEFLEAVRRALKDDGLFIFNYVNMWNNLVATLQKSKYFIYRPPICYAYTRPVMEQIMDKFGFDILATYRDIRVMDVQKIVTLLGWQWALRLSQALHINRVAFPVYAYPSQIVVARKISP